uniref:Uncharacterized protein n=1 Tax=Rhizophora mucronata TaxID=61149 RepID=A0A2P2N5W6_RHIMU
MTTSFICRALLYTNMPWPSVVSSHKLLISPRSKFLGCMTSVQRQGTKLSLRFFTHAEKN